MKERATKYRPFLLLGALMILLAVSGCRFVPEPNQERGSLIISAGLSEPGVARRTFTPIPDIYNFRKLVYKITKISMEIEVITVIDEETGEETEEEIEVEIETIIAEVTRNPRYEGVVIELFEVPYDTYVISAWAYVDESHTADNYAAFGKLEFTFGDNSSWVTVPMDFLIGEAGSTGILRYKVINAIGLPIVSDLYPYNEVNDPYAKMTLTQGLNPQDTIGGFYTRVLETGFYVFFFGENEPSIIHIYKNVETILEDEYTIYGSVNWIAYPEENTDVQIIISVAGNPIEPDSILSYGTDVKITIVNGDDYRFKKSSPPASTINLNGGSDNNWFITPETYNSDGTSSRNFRMTGHDVVITIETELIPKLQYDFEDPNMFKYLKILNAANNMEISSALPGQEIRVAFIHPDADSIPFTVQSWWLDLESQPGSARPDNLDNKRFTVPDPCPYWSVAVIVNIGNLPYSVNIPIKHN